jgi:TolB-like protein
MPIWSAEIKVIQILLNSFKGQFPDLEKELNPLITSEDSNVVMLYSRRCLEIIITELCEVELKRPRKTEPLKGIIDKLNSEEKVPSNIITSMHGLNSLSTFGTHPKDFDQEQIKPVLNNLAIIIRWYLKYKDTQIKGDVMPGTQNDPDRTSTLVKGKNQSKTKKILIYSFTFLLVIVAILVIVKLNAFNNKLEKSIAVLPFRNDSRDSSTIIFMDGVMEEILNRVQAIKELSPISRSSVEQYRNTKKSLPEIAKERHVNYILEGSGQKFGDSIILRVQLIEIRKGRERHLMGSSFRQKLESANTFFNIQSLVAQSIATELNAKITPQEMKLIEKLPTDNLVAYEAYLRGQYYLNIFTPDALDSAMHYFELAKEIDPDYALAYTGICDVWAYRQQWGLVIPAEGNLKSMEAVMKAYAIDSNNAVVQYTLAHKKTWGMFDWKGGEKGFKYSISLNPNNAMTHAVYSHLLSILGRKEEAMKQIEIAIKLDPMNPFILVFYGADLSIARKHNDALKAIDDALEIEPGYLFALGARWHIAYAGGHVELAYNSLKSFWSMVDPESAQSLEQGYLKDGFDGAFLSLANRLGEIWTINQNQFFVPCDIATFYAAGHDIDKSIFWLEKAYNFHDPNLPYLLFPIYDNIRNDPRFKDLCQRMKLPWNINT